MPSAHERNTTAFRDTLGFSVTWCSNFPLDACGRATVFKNNNGGMKVFDIGKEHVHDVVASWRKTSQTPKRKILYAVV